MPNPELKAKVTADTSNFRKGMDGISSAATVAACVAVVALSAIAAALAKLGTNAISEAANIETLTLQMKQFTGDLKLAKDEIKRLSKFSDVTPFTKNEVIKASISLRRLTDGMLGAVESIELVGEAAARSGEPLPLVSRRIGILYGQLKRGEPFREYAMELQKSGVVSGKFITVLEKMKAAGASFESQWEFVKKELKGTGTALKDLSGSWNGLVSTLKGKVQNILSELGEDALPEAKLALEDFIKTLTDLTKTTEFQQLKQDFKDLIIDLRESKLFSLENLREATAMISSIVDLLREIIKLKELLTEDNWLARGGAAILDPNRVKTSGGVKTGFKSVDTNELKDRNLREVIRQLKEQGFTMQQINEKLENG